MINKAAALLIILLLVFVFIGTACNRIDGNKVIAVSASAAFNDKPAATVKQSSDGDGSIIHVADNPRLKLDFNPQTAEVTLLDHESGALWSSNPADRDTDNIAKGVKKLDLQAQLILDYNDSQYQPFQVSNTSSIRSKTFTWKQAEGGIEVTFNFKEGGFSIPVRYSIGKDYFSAEILTDRILQQGSNQLVNIALIPFFGAGSIKDQGYVFVPDGSGALIQFNNNKSVYRDYNERVYGGEQSLDLSEKTAVKEDIKLPVFGLEKNRQAFAAVISQGEYQAGITAEVSGKNNQYNRVYSYLNLIESETNLVMEGSLNEKQVLRTSKSLTGPKPFEVRYYFLNGDKADYVGMAQRYRQYLIEEKGVKPIVEPADKQGTPLQLNFLGAIKKWDTFIGIPYNTLEVLTSYSDLQTAVDRILHEGINNLSVKYEGWMSGGMKGAIPVKLAAESKLGGSSGFKALSEFLHSKSIAFYPAVNPIDYYKSGGGFNKFFDAAKGISRAPALQYEYQHSSGMRNRLVQPWYLLKPESAVEALDKIAASAKKKGIDSLDIQGIGNTVYSDFRKNTLPKNKSGLMWEDGLKQTKSQIGAMSFDKGNAYTFPFASELSDVPLYSSGFDVEDEEVPFYSIVLSGLIPVFSEPVNLSADPDLYLLKLLESGTYPKYRFIARDGSLLTNTDYDGLYSGDFTLWFDDLVKEYHMIDDVLGQVKGQPIIGHTVLQEGVRETRYANGKMIIVNYNDQPVVIGTDQVDAKGYLLK